MLWNKSEIAIKRRDHGELISAVQTAAYHGSPGCAEPISERCFRRQHFGWCTTHALMTDENDVCPHKPQDIALLSMERCTTVYSGRPIL